MELYLSARARYLFYTLHQCLQLPQFSLTVRMDTLAALLKVLVSLVQEDASGYGSEGAYQAALRSFSALVAVDNLMSKGQWVELWSKLLLGASTLQELEANARKEMGLPPPDDLSAKQVRKELGPETAQAGGDGGGGDNADNAVKDKADGGDDSDAEAEAAEADPHQTHGTGPDSPDDFTKGIRLARVNSYCPTPNMLGGHPDAESLGLSDVNTVTLRRLELQLEDALWRLATAMEESSSMELFALANKSEAIQMKYPSSETQFLPYVGRVVQGGRQPHGQQQFLCQVFGISFYVEPLPEKSGICVPAWSCRVVTRADMAFWELKRTLHKVKLQSVLNKQQLAPDFKVTLPSEMQNPQTQTSPDKEKNESDGATPSDAAASAPEDQATLAKDQLMLEFHMNALVPSSKLDEKMENDLKGRKERAEKSARQLVEKSVRTKSKKGTKWELIEDANERAAAIEQQMQHEKEADRLADEAVAKCEMLSHVPLSRMASAEERTARSQRSRMMQEALETAKQEAAGTATAVVEDDESIHRVGLAAVVLAAEKSLGTGDAAAEGPRPKKKAKKGPGGSKDAKQKATADILKIARHLLR